MTKHLYIHIPFCESICSYCDFCRFKMQRNNPIVDEYIEKILQHVNEESYEEQYTSIYLGGGTPNFLSDQQLNYLLSSLVKYLNLREKYEFCLECNPDFITATQVSIFKDNHINRVSIGAQTTNDDILKIIERKHTFNDVKKAVNLLQDAQINNISLDFIYALDGLTFNDIDLALQFLVDYHIPHVSFYALEVKDGSKMKANKYVVNEDDEADQLEYIIKQLKERKFNRYEVSNWSVDKEHESLHNKTYWLTNDWKAIGLSASGFEDNIMYKWEGTLSNWERVGHRLSTAELYLQILMMGLRLSDGIEVMKNKRNAEAYALYFDDIVNCTLVNDHLICNDINMLHECLVNMIDVTKEKQLDNIKDKVYTEEN